MSLISSCCASRRCSQVHLRRTGINISSGNESLNPPLYARAMGLRTDDKTTTSLGDFLSTSLAALFNILAWLKGRKEALPVDVGLKCSRIESLTGASSEYILRKNINRIQSNSGLFFAICYYSLSLVPLSTVISTLQPCSYCAQHPIHPTSSEAFFSLYRALSARQLQLNHDRQTHQHNRKYPCRPSCVHNCAWCTPYYSLYYRHPTRL